MYNNFAFYKKNMNTLEIKDLSKLITDMWSQGKLPHGNLEFRVILRIITQISSLGAEALESYTVETHIQYF